MEYVPPLGSVDPNAPYVDANPAAGLDGSAVPAAAIEQPMREIVFVETQAGLAPAEGDTTQLYDAIMALIAANMPAGFDPATLDLRALAHRDFGLGLEDDGANGARVKLADTSLARGAAGLKVSAVPTTIGAGGAVVTAANNMANYVATAACTITLPRAQTAGVCAFSVLAHGGAVTLTPDVNDAIQGGAAGASWSLPIGGSCFVVTDGGAAGKWWAFLNSRTVTTYTTLTSGSGTYAPPAGAKQLEVEFVGGGGGGGAWGGGSNGGAGGVTAFNGITAVGGAGGITVGGNGYTAGGAGGTGGTGAAFLRIAGQNGQLGSAGYGNGSAGGGSVLGMGGMPNINDVTGQAGTGFGSGGSAAYHGQSGGSAGGGGEYVKLVINGPAATYAYVVGSGGTGGTGTYAGGAGAGGAIIIKEIY
jgi:hypothetical protein